MILNMLLIVCGVPLAKACLAMDPGDHISCPSVPQQTPQGPDDVNDYSGVMGPTIVNGDTVYTCKPPALMFEYEGSEKKELPQDTKLSCKSNSGFFVLENGLDVKTKKFNCGEGDYTKCPAVPKTTKEPTDPFLTTELKGPKYENGAQVYYCTEPEALIAFTDEGEGSGAFPPADTLLCKSKSDKYELENLPSNIDSFTFSCGKRPKGCAEFGFGGEIQDMLLKKAELDYKFEKGKSIYSCDGMYRRLFIVTGDIANLANMQALPEGASITCDGVTGELSYFNGEMDIPYDPSDKTKFACTKLKCRACDDDVDKDYEYNCNNHPMVTCKSRPIKADDDKECPLFSCAGSDKLFVIEKATAIEVVNANIKCNGEKWLFNNNVPLPSDSTVVCGTVKSG